LHLALRDVGEDFLRVGVRTLDPGELGRFQAQVFHRALMHAAGRNLDLATRRLHDGRRSVGLAAEDQVLAYELVTRAELDASRQRDAGRESRRRKMRAARGHFFDRRFARPDRVQPQGHAKVLGEPAGEVVGRAFGALAAEVIRIRAVARDDAQLAVVEDLLQ
jgi:hypothetical protein